MLQCSDGFCHLSQSIRNSHSRRLRVWSQTPSPKACVFIYELPLLLPPTHNPPITHRTTYSHNNKQMCTVLRTDKDSLLDQTDKGSSKPFFLGPHPMSCTVLLHGPVPAKIPACQVCVVRNPPPLTSDFPHPYSIFDVEVFDFSFGKSPVKSA